ncbi:hypothetical protein A5733_11455 [Mycobacterium sp. NS-7484]|uniref:hypothetical protein n=1 Tax=Mycobacterium sp. NS-7484 TaxID=1834161 RepID=UPI00096F5A31|nr:hypothetical protein [Mycobacterium sp. NS-7484]OMB94622.1 hypothetical protein A5733_13645 [Mycobacterium sp. NS-7484]OMB96481.1 hypothetical protein A5733_11455 [Mycobacterium sp. NS-7484]
MNEALCPGSGHQTGVIGRIGCERGIPHYATCPYCRRGYATNLNGRIRKHQGLPKPPDGGCPYKCPGPECDFACYHPEVTDA